MIVIDTPFTSVQGRKPSRPAFLYDFHNDDDGGTTVVDRFGNAKDLALQGTLGTSWTAKRGFWIPNGTDQYGLITAGTNENYAALDVMADAVLNAGQALFVAWRLGWTGTKTSSTEMVLTLGRSNANARFVQVGHNNTGIINFIMRGNGASAVSSVSFGSSALYTNGSLNNLAVHIEATVTGVIVNAWLNGVAVGTTQEIAWTANGGTKPTRDQFVLPDGITIGATRAGSNSAAPIFNQLVGATTTGGSYLSNVLAVNLEEANIALASALALELHQNPRFISETLAAL